MQLLSRSPALKNAAGVGGGRPASKAGDSFGTGKTRGNEGGCSEAVGLRWWLCQPMLVFHCSGGSVVVGRWHGEDENAVVFLPLAPQGGESERHSRR